MNKIKIIEKSKEICAELIDRMEGLYTFAELLGCSVNLHFCQKNLKLDKFQIDDEHNALSGTYRDILFVNISLKNNKYVLSNVKICIDENTVKELTASEIAEGVKNREIKQRFIREFLNGDISTADDVEKVIHEKHYQHELEDINETLTFEFQVMSAETLNNLYEEFKYKSETIKKTSCWMFIEVFDIVKDDLGLKWTDEEINCIEITGYKSQKTHPEYASVIACIYRDSKTVEYHDERAKNDEYAKRIINEVLASLN